MYQTVAFGDVLIRCVVLFAVEINIGNGIILLGEYRRYIVPRLFTVDNDVADASVGYDTAVVSARRIVSQAFDVISGVVVSNFIAVDRKFLDIVRVFITVLVIFWDIAESVAPAIRDLMVIIGP